MRKYVIMGVQGSGKGTQGAMLARDFDLTQIASATSSAGMSRTTPSSARRCAGPWPTAGSSTTTLVEAVVRRTAGRS